MQSAALRAGWPNSEKVEYTLEPVAAQAGTFSNRSDPQARLRDGRSTLFWYSLLSQKVSVAGPL